MGKVTGMSGCSAAAGGRPLDAVWDIDGSRPFIAVATSDGVTIDQSLDQVDRLTVYRPGSASVAGRRTWTATGTGSFRWLLMAAALGDCHGVLTTGAPTLAAAILDNRGIRLAVVAGPVAAALGAVAEGRGLGFLAAPGSCSCSSPCSTTTLDAGAFPDRPAAAGASLIPLSALTRPPVTPGEPS